MKKAGFGLRCYDAGIVLEVLYNGLGVADEQFLHQPFPALCEPSSLAKALSLLAQTRAVGAAFDCELDLRLGAEIALARCCAARLGNDLLILGSQGGTDEQEVFYEAMRLNNAQASLMRSVLKDQPSGREAEELVRLNLELVAMERDLLRKNAQLEELNAELRRLATTDSLTGLFNRRGFFQLARREVDLWKRFGKVFALLMFDIDHFKAVNDTYGHDAGDAVLTGLADRCRRELRQVDILGRFGGEEFVALLPQTGLEGAEQAAERLRLAIAKTPFETPDRPVPVTVSLGVVVHGERAEVSLDELLRQADEALYAAKDAGRNCHRVFAG